MISEVSPRHLLLILDGYGIANDRSVSAIDAARKPFLDTLFATYPWGRLEASGRAVGLPEGQMGNSEVGHMNLGAGRIVYQDITRIDVAIEDGSFFENVALVDALRKAKVQSSRVHLLGLLSDGGVHSHIRHLYALIEMARREALLEDQLWIHAFTDGRDTDPHAGVEYVLTLESHLETQGIGRIASICGRYWAMDRDNRWERTARAYKLLTHRGTDFTEDENAVSAIQKSYADGITDEFISPVRIAHSAPVNDGDVIIFFNFRADRARQLTRAFTIDDFDGFDRGDRLDIEYVTFTPYDAVFQLPVAFPKENLFNTMGETIASYGLTQLRAAETEKYPHVTYFYSGGRESPFPGEERILVPSPKVPTYDLQPEMSVYPLAERVAAYLREEHPNYVVLNFANPDMVGHTGVFEAAVQAIEAVDTATKIVVESALAEGYNVQIIADHGNADQMRNADGSPHTAHTTVPVPHLIIKEGFIGPVKPGVLADVAPTALSLMGLPIPESMTGDVLYDASADKNHPSKG